MSRAEPTRKERLEHFLLRLIQHPGADQGHTRDIRLLLWVLKRFSRLFQAIVQTRLFLYEVGILPRFHLGCQIISVGNVTVGGTGKTPVVEIFARELTAAGRQVAILSRGYRKKEKPFIQRLFLGDQISPPRVVSDGKRILLDSEMSGDEPYMLARNLPGVVVLVDKDRVKSGRYAIKHFGCDMLILDDGFQYQRMKHRHEVVLVDHTNPFGNGHLLPRGILREPAGNIRRANFIFITKSDGNSGELRRRLHALNPRAEITECRHRPCFFKNAETGAKLELADVAGKQVVVLSGIAAPAGFENSVRQMGARVLVCERFVDHHRYRQQEIIDVVNHAVELGADAILTTEKDAVRLPRIENPRVPIFYLRMDIQILKGYDNFKECVDRICFARAADA
ncbi:MAG: tetraacyldisaccharide 4'-kinase [Lentisphaerae bacterium]|nr:tetraacyldisaccharide 4'-kinase [Lentisphaerota bacterium]